MIYRAVEMRAAVTIALAAVLLAAGVSAGKESLPFDLRHYGNFKRMMHTENIEGVVSLEQALSGEHVYAVGALEKAEGEVTVHGGKAWISYGRDGIDTVIHDVPDGEQAMLLVTARVEEWREIVIPDDMPDHELYLFILNQAEKNGLFTDAPFPLLLEGPVKNLVWHVIDGPAPGTERHGEHAFIKRLIDRRQEVSATLIGFYSAGIQGVFTHPGESWHTHVVLSEEGKAGHVESFSVRKGAILKLPVK